MDPGNYTYPSAEVARAAKMKLPLVALESTVITHGLPYPQNLQIARDMEATVRRVGAMPATIAVMEGRIKVGLTGEELAQLAQARNSMKISRRDIAASIVRKATGGTTVAATMYAASAASIRVFATGGIGGIHRGNPFDVSTDLRALAETPMIVVCAGAKAILDLPATLEYLETAGVPVVGYKTDEFPAFYSRTSGLGVSLRLDSAAAIAEFAQTHWSLGLWTTVLVANPVPELDAIPQAEIEPVIARATKEAAEKHIHGQALTPFLLQRISEMTAKRSMRANLALLLNNAQLAAEIAVAHAGLKPKEGSLRPTR
jgi:pseudouridine-5'-phosphate glycosidase